MATISFTIDNAKLPRIIDAMKWLFPIPVNSSGQPLFTDAQWAKEALRRYIIDQTLRYELQKARNAVSVSKDDTLLT